MTLDLPNLFSYRISYLKCFCHSFQEDVKESLLINDKIIKNKQRIEKLKYTRKSLVKEQQDLEAKKGELSQDVKDLEARIAAGRRGEDLMVNVDFSDVFGDIDTGIDPFLSSSSGDDNNLLENFDLTVFDI